MKQIVRMLKSIPKYCRVTITVTVHCSLLTNLALKLLCELFQLLLSVSKRNTQNTIKSLQSVQLNDI